MGPAVVGVGSQPSSRSCQNKVTAASAGESDRKGSHRMTLRSFKKGD